MKLLTLNQIKKMHDQQIQKFGGLAGVKDAALLESAVHNSFYSEYFGNDMYPTLEEKAARLCFSIINNHPFIDGNKRTGVQSMLVLLGINGVKLKISNEDVYRLGVNVASSKWGYEDILQFIRDHKQ